MAKVSFDIKGEGSKIKGDDAPKIMCEFVRCPKKTYKNQDETRTDLNEYYINPRFVSGEKSTNLVDWQAERGELPDHMRAINELQKERLPEGKKPRKINDDTVLIRNIVIQTGADAWYPGMKNWSKSLISKSTFEQRQASGPFLIDKARLWGRDTIKMLQQKFGDNLLSVQIHLDEGGPHLHVQIVPVMDDGRLTNFAFFADKNGNFNPWQKQFRKELADVGAKYGLQMSEDGGERTTEITKFKEIQQQEQAEAAKDAEEWLQEIKRESGDAIEPERISDIPLPEYEEVGLIGRKRKMISYDDFMRYKKAVDKATAKNTQLLEDVDRNAKSVIIGNKVERDRLEKAGDKIADMEHKMKSLYQQIAELKEQINAMDTGAVIEQIYGAEPKKQSATTVMYEFDGHKIAVKNGRLFMDNHDSEIHGAGPIALIMQIENLSFRQSLDFIAANIGADATYKIAIHDDMYRKNEIDTLKSNKSGQKVQAPAPTAQPNINRLEYLFVQQRKIRPEIVHHLVISKQIYTDQHLNAVVPRMHGGAFVRGTGKPKPDQKSFKRTVGGKSCGVATLKGPQATPESPVMICEGITDGVALIDMFPDREVWLVGGNMVPDMEFDPQRSYILACDNDKEGQAIMRKIEDDNPDILFRHWQPIQGKDASESLEIERKQRKSREEQKQADKLAEIKASVSVNNNPCPKPR